MYRVEDRFGFFHLALLCSAFLFIILLAGMSPPALAASPITGVSVYPPTAAIHSGQAVYVRATVQGTGDFDHRVNWSLSPGNAGSISPTGLFISAPSFIGTATVKATSVESSTFSAAAITVSAGGGVVHVDHTNAGIEDGSALHPYRTIQGAINNAANGDTIKVAQGTYTESVDLPGLYGALLLGGFKGGSAEDYAANQPGDFVTRSTDHVNQVTTIQSPNRSTSPVVHMENWTASNPTTYAVDGFTLSGGFSGLDLRGNGPVYCFVSQNLITNNGPVTPVTYDRGGGVRAEGLNILVLNNHIVNNQTDWGGGFFISTGANSFLVQGNLIENNIALGGLGNGGGALEVNGAGENTPLFTWNVVRGNRAGDLLNYGSAGGIGLHSGRAVELSHNVYGNNQTKDQGGGVSLDGMAVLRHELIYRNSNNSSYSAAGVHVQPNSNLTLDHCTITGNVNANEGSVGGLYVRELGTAQVSNSIIWGNSGNQLYADQTTAFSMTYSDSQPYSGTGNLSVAPLFADPAADDYHLKSRRGRWNPAKSGWVRDTVHSPCIDAGNPVAAFGQEPIPNGLRTNMGAYGNTTEASKSLQSLLDGMLYHLLGN
jgi:hypothetical protein